MILAAEIEKATHADPVVPGALFGELNGWAWTASQAWAVGGVKYKVDVSRRGVRGSHKCIATRANRENIFQLIADYINKNA